jgi:hypothetical protein
LEGLVREQSVDLRSTWTMLRRRSRVLVIAAVLGALAGLALLYFFPPPFSSRSEVLLPTVTQGDAGKTGGYDPETQIRIVTGAEVLERAGQQVEPKLTKHEVDDRVVAEAPTDSIVDITAHGPTSGQAEALTRAVASSLVEYLNDTSQAVSSTAKKAYEQRLATLTASLKSVNAEIKKAEKRIADKGRSSEAGRFDAAALSNLTAERAETVLAIDALKKQLAGDGVASGRLAAGAEVVDPASPGVRATFVADALTMVLGGAAVFLFLTTVYLLVTNHRDPKLRARDEIADAVGIPVVMSLRTRPPRSPHGWRELFRAYAPDSPDAWALRQLLHGLLSESWKDWPTGEGFVLVVLCVSGDDAGLAVGPQIASFAASNGIATQLHAAQRHESATTLWAACSHTTVEEELPPNLSVVTAPNVLARVDLTVRVVVLDRDNPEPNALLVGERTALLAVSSASATRRNLADVVVAADRVEVALKGIVVANPDPLDRTTGRLTPLERPGASPQAPPASPQAPQPPPLAPQRPAPAATPSRAVAASGASASARGPRRPATGARSPR